jgi:hypothetical protein
MFYYYVLGVAYYIEFDPMNIYGVMTAAAADAAG